MVRSSRFLAASVAAAVLLTAYAESARGQAAGADTVCTYMSCALRFEGRHLVRGVGGETVTRSGFIAPLRLEQHVVGDSALFYAGKHDRAATRAAWLSNGGAFAMLAGLAIAVIRDRGCEPFNFESCRDGDALHVTSTGLVIGGTVATFASFPFVRQAWSLQARAVWWNNARFAPEQSR